MFDSAWYCMRFGKTSCRSVHDIRVIRGGGHVPGAVPNAADPPNSEAHSDENHVLGLTKSDMPSNQRVCPHPPCGPRETKQTGAA